MAITLIGMPGAGKSTVGRLLARRLDYSFVDTDELLRALAVRPLQDLIEEEGEAELLRLEEQAVLAMQIAPQTVVATGGSVVYSMPAISFLCDRSELVLLDIPFPLMCERLNDLEQRGVVGLKKKSLHELYQERTILYWENCSMVVKIAPEDSPQSVVEKILQL